MASKRNVRFVSDDESLGSVIVGDVVLERNGEAQSLTEDQLKRVEEVVPKGSIQNDNDRGSSSKKED